MDEFPPDHPYDAPPASEAAAMPPLPIENPVVPWLKGLIDTVVLFTSKPGEAFARMSHTGGLMRPVVYALLTGTVGFLVGFSWQALMLPLSQQFTPGAEPTVLTGGMMLAFAVCIPPIIVAGVFFNALIYHVSLMIVGGAKRGIGVTLRTVCYSYTALLAVALPICGSLIGTIWTLYLLIVGLSEAHGISKGRAAVAVLLPSVLVCICVIFVMIAAFSSLKAAGILPGIAP